MLSYEPLYKYLEKNDLSIYDMEQMTGIPHSSAYRIRNNDGAVSLPVLNRIMYVFGMNSLDEVVKYYPSKEEAPESAEPIEIVDDLFETYTKKANRLRGTDD